MTPSDRDPVEAARIEIGAALMDIRLLDERKRELMTRLSMAYEQLSNATSAGTYRDE